jgi:hypothetical protein
MENGPDMCLILLDLHGMWWALQLEIVSSNEADGPELCLFSTIWMR